MKLTHPKIIDTDTHFTEPAELWEGALPKEWSDVTLKVRWNGALQREVWTLGEKIISPAWNFLQFGYKRAGVWGEGPSRLENAHPATYIQSERVKIMDDAGVRAAVLYPNLAGVRFEAFAGMDSLEVSAAHISVYNDYQLDWALATPGRFIPMLVVPFWDLPRAVNEIARMKDKGFGGIVTTGAPQNHGQPFLADHHWDPLWEACVDAGLSVSFHIGNGITTAASSPARLKVDLPGTTLGRVATFPFLDNAKQVTDLLLSGVLARYPELRFVSVESGIGWVPFVLESLDYHHAKDTRDLKAKPFGDLTPSDLFHRQVYVNYWFEKLTPFHVDAVGADNILFETDFPHPTCLEPADVEERLANGFAGHPDDVREKILWRNALKLYGKALGELEANVAPRRRQLRSDIRY